MRDCCIGQFTQSLASDLKSVSKTSTVTITDILEHSKKSIVDVANDYKDNQLFQFLCKVTGCKTCDNPKKLKHLVGAMFSLSKCRNLKYLHPVPCAGSVVAHMVIHSKEAVELASKMGAGPSMTKTLGL